MYLEYILIALGIASGVMALALLIYLIASKRKIFMYKKILEDQTDTLDISTIITSLSENIVRSSETLERTLTMGEDFQEADGNILDIDEWVFDGKYKLEREIYGGGMSRVFLAKNVKLGNQWIIKFISHSAGKLANEESILKRLNHINLPSIVDIFFDKKGVYIVESYIEGVSLQEIIKSGAPISQSNVQDWFEQLSQVISYLHSMKPSSIIHCDLKPSNIIITPDKKLVLIDFGISKFQGDDDGSYSAVTYKYAAPEQLKHKISEYYKPLIDERFGPLPPERMQWSVDKRTDIYSLGVMMYELSVGQIPTVINKGLLLEKTSKEMAEIINRCIELDPENRYQSVSQILEEIQNVKKIGHSMVRSLLMRRVAFVSMFLLLVLSGATITGGAYVLEIETLSVLAMSPNIITVSLQQSTELSIEKFLPDGTKNQINASELKWEYKNDNVARIDGNAIAGINEGKTTVTGRYKNKIVELSIEVIKPIEGIVDVSLRYKYGSTVEHYAGTGKSYSMDGNLKSTSFIAPASLTIDAEGYTYIADANDIRIIDLDGEVGTISFDESYIIPKIVRCSGTDLFVLTESWKDVEEGMNVYAFMKMNESGTEVFFLGQADYSNILDFVVSDNQILYYLEYIDPTFTVTLNAMDLTTGEVEALEILPHTVSAISLYEQNIYLASKETGIIQKFDLTTNTLGYLAGIENERNIIDGNLPMFYSPTRIKAVDDALYVLDFNILRKINIQDGVLQSVETVAGEVMADFNPIIKDGEGQDAVFTHSELADFIITEDGIIISDPKNGVLRKIKERR